MPPRQARWRSRKQIRKNAHPIPRNWRPCPDLDTVMWRNNSALAMAIPGQLRGRCHRRRDCAMMPPRAPNRPVRGLSMLRIGTFLIAFIFLTPAALAETVRDCASDDHERAIRACTQLIQRNPRNATYYYNRAISYRETGRIDQALADYN